MELIIWALLFVLGGFGLVIPTLDYVKKTKLSRPLSLLAAVIATILTAYLVPQPPQTLFNGAIRVDHFSSFLAFIASLGALLVIAASSDQAKDWSTAPSMYSLMVLALLGVYFILFVADATVLIASWALVAVASYVLVGIKKDERSLEGAAKYAIMGIASSSFLIYGLALTLGVLGTTSLPWPTSEVVTDWHRYVLVVGAFLLVAAFSFKLGVVPFHGWLPDVYGGVHPLLVSYVAGVIKLIAIGALVRVVAPLIPSMKVEWTAGIAILSVITMFYGNLAALVQRNVQRMMAYSSIAHAGYILIGFFALAYSGLPYAMGFQGIGLHVLTYVLAKIGIFVGLAYFAKKGFDLTLEGISGIGRRLPITSAAFAILLLSLMGMPPLLGFWSKFLYLFNSVIDVAPWLAFLGIVNSGISVGYYALVLRYMYFSEPKEGSETREGDDMEIYVVLTTAILTVLIGLGLAPRLAVIFSP